MLMNIGLGPGACEERRERMRGMQKEMERERKIKRTEGGRMEEDNGFSPNKCTARGTCRGRKTGIRKDGK